MAYVEETLVDLTIEEKEEVALPLDSEGSKGRVPYETVLWLIRIGLRQRSLEFQLSPSYYASAQGWGRSYVYDLPHGFMSEMVAKLLSNFVGHFLEYDIKAISLRKNKTLNWGRASLYELRLGKWQRHRVSG
ncbi:hypothetical protein J1N35_005304 [Gossypium stocksii]|uniref:Uncharacterized protein n=1 Tax=Gossypium stocksii TaxID=47602 RepID=A0A9D3WCM2_9ROSI|nr:hypothetical protein J1N35_005304 [Gossypium stocksii]